VSRDATPPYAFSDPGPERHDERRLDAAWLQAAWTQARVLAVNAEGEVLAAGSPDEPQFPRGGELRTTLPASAVFLGQDGDEPAWFALPAVDLADAEACARHGLRALATQWPATAASAAARARALLHWQARHRHCGACGQPTVPERGGWVLRCGHCGAEDYPRTDAAVIVAVSDGERLLLGRQPQWDPGRWSVLAGFVEPGESLEQTVRREVFEEAGVVVGAVRYLASQPWPFPAALMIAFEADATPQPPRVGDELEQAQWFGRDELRQLLASGAMKAPPRLSVSRWLIERWLRAGAD
jgi:NAD+ diphosphatase